MSKIKLFQDGPSLTEIDKYFDKVDGYTFNPSLFKKLGAKDYLEFTKEIIKKLLHLFQFRNNLMFLSDRKNTYISQF